jgi:hypothetical protein
MNLKSGNSSVSAISPSLFVQRMQVAADQAAAFGSELVAAREIITRQADRILELEQLVGIRVEWPFKVALTATQAKIFSMLLAASGPVGKPSVMTAIYGVRPECDWPKHPGKILDVQVYHLRKVVEPHGVQIDTVALSGGHCGYWLRPATREAARALIAGPQP